MTLMEKWRLEKFKRSNQMQEQSAIHDQVSDLFRKSYGKLVSLLLSKFGFNYLELVENAVMESYYRALKTWPLQSPPTDSVAWLYRTAYNSLLDDLRKKSREKEWSSELESRTEEVDFSSDENIHDPELKLLFLICHPSLDKGDRLTFMLKTLAGLGNREIASALMKQEATIKKRLLRARKRLKEQNVRFAWPEPHELIERLELVHTSLYLLFNEGFYSSHRDKWIRKDLCLESMRLCKYLAEHPLANSETFGLMALMCYHISRYESRIDQQGDVILLDQQDRSKWNDYFINLGHYYLEKSASISNQKNKYQLEAFISCQHCMATSLESTNWQLLKTLYSALYKLEKSDLILLNLVVVHLHLDDLTKAKSLFESIDQSVFANKVSYFMVGVQLYEKLKDSFQIELMLEQAIHSSDSGKENEALQQKLKELKK